MTEIHAEITTARATSPRSDAPAPLELPPWIISAGLALAALPFVALTWFLLRAPREALVATMPDDSFYYLEIGQRAARGEGFTFDGLNRTSGYHPMWQWIVTATEWVAPGETAQVRAVRLISLLLVALAFALVTRVIWRAAGPLPALGGLLVASHSVSNLRSLSSGMETPVVLLALALCFATLTAFFSEPDRRHALFVGLASAMLVLARLDMIAVVPLLALAVITRTPRLRNLGGWVAGGAVLGVPYAVYHLIAHGSLLTTSATVKDRWVSDHIAGLGGWFSGPHLEYLRYLVRSYAEAIVQRIGETPFAGLEVVLGLSVACLALLGGWSSLRKLRSAPDGLQPTGAAGAWMVGLATAKFVVDLAVVPLWVLAWYAAAGQTTAFFVIGAAAGSGLTIVIRTQRAALWATASLLAGIAMLPSGLGLTVTDTPPGLAWQRELDRAATWLAENRPPGRYGAFDAGLLGYRMDGISAVENLDGLVNDAEFAHYLSSRPSSVEVVRHEEIDVLINRVTFEGRRTEWACATTLWEGEESISSQDPERPDKVYVLDVRACR